MSVLPSLADINEAKYAPLAEALTILLELPESLHGVLIPSLVKVIQNRKSVLTSYSELIDLAFDEISKWDRRLRAEFIAGHPRIGESKNLSALSAKEQGSTGAMAPTPPEVLARLAHLNACYERKYPGLRYITFVNGRSRAEIALELEDMLGIDHSLSATEPPMPRLKPIDIKGEEWAAELIRAVTDVRRIAKSRLKGLGMN